MLPMAILPSRGDLKKGLGVEIETKEDQGTGRLTVGVVKEILTASKYHPYGIKVRLQSGQVGRVKKITTSTTEKQARSFTNLDIKSIPKTEDKYNEFKEFYQYDARIENLASAGAAERRTAVKRIMNSVRERFAIAVCAFGNSSSGGFVHLGIRADGTVAGLERDRKIGNFADYEDLFANHIRDTLETFLQDRVFILRNIQIVFRRIDGKTICTVQVLPAGKPLYVHVNKEQRFYVRGPTPRAERLAGQEEQFRYIKSRFSNYG